MNATVTALAAGPTLAQAADAFLSRRDLDPDTLRSYAQTLRRLSGELGEETPLSGLTADQVALVVDHAWAQAAARTANRHRAALRSFTGWAAGRGWLTADLAALVDRRPQTQDRTKAIDRRTIEALWDRRDIGLPEKTLWRLLYESAARAGSVLSLDVEILELDNKRGRTTAKGGVIRWIQWQSGTARLLLRLLDGAADRPAIPHRPPPQPRPHTRGPPTSAPTPAGPGCPTNAPSTCSNRPPSATTPPAAGTPSTSSATPG
jgi:integrase